MAHHHTRHEHEGHKDGKHESKAGRLKIHGGFKAAEHEKMGHEKKAPRKK